MRGAREGRVFCFSPALLQDAVVAGGDRPRQCRSQTSASRRLIQVDLVCLQMAGAGGREVLQPQVHTFPSRNLDGPVAPQGRVGTQVVRREELAAVPMQYLVTTSQGKECISVFAGRST